MTATSGLINGSRLEHTPLWALAPFYYTTTRTNFYNKYVVINPPPIIILCLSWYYTSRDTDLGPSLALKIRMTLPIIWSLLYAKECRLQRSYNFSEACELYVILDFYTHPWSDIAWAMVRKAEMTAPCTNALRRTKDEKADKENNISLVLQAQNNFMYRIILAFGSL